jgi:hypothetical protein
MNPPVLYKSDLLNTYFGFVKNCKNGEEKEGGPKEITIKFVFNPYSYRIFWMNNQIWKAVNCITGQRHLSVSPDRCLF